MQLQILIGNVQRSGRKRYRAVDWFKTLLKQILIVIKAPPAFPIECVSNVKLRRWILLCRICALPLVTSRSKLLTSKEREGSIELFLINLVSSGGNLSSGCHLREAAWL